MNMETATVEFMYSRDHSPASKRWYRARLGAFASWLAAQGVADIEAITAHLVRRYLDERRTAISRTGKPLDSHSLHGHARAVRALLFWAASEDLLDVRVPQRVSLPKKADKVLPVLAEAQTEALFAACEIPRDRAILAILLDTGIRASELCSLTVDHVHFSAEDAYLVVHGKGRKSREVGLGRRSRMLLHKYLYRTRGGVASGPVFIGRTGTALRPEGLDRMLYRLRDRARLQGVRVGAHVWRHTYAYRYIAAGGDLFRLSRLMGHSSVTTTQGYLTAFDSREARRGFSVLDGPAH
jgi:site-specific recombinase XerD